MLTRTHCGRAKIFPSLAKVLTQVKTTYRVHLGAEIISLQNLPGDKNCWRWKVNIGLFRWIYSIRRSKEIGQSMTGNIWKIINYASRGRLYKLFKKATNTSHGRIKRMKNEIERAEINPRTFYRQKINKLHFGHHKRQLKAFFEWYHVSRNDPRGQPKMKSTLYRLLGKK